MDLPPITLFCGHEYNPDHDEGERLVWCKVCGAASVVDIQRPRAFVANVRDGSDNVKEDHGLSR